MRREGEYGEPMRDMIWLIYARVRCVSEFDEVRIIALLCQTLEDRTEFLARR